MNRDKIIIKNAHTNNLKNIDIEIPKHKLVVFTGVSGSGKSSLLFDTIYTEAQRQLVETFSTFARTRMPKLSRPDVDDILNLSTAIVIDQKRMGNNLRSTVGTATEINTYLRLLFSRIGKPFIGPSFYFSFNHPEGMCPHCNGLGKQIKIDLDLFLDKEKSIREGAISHPHYKVGGFLWKELVSLNVVDSEKPLKEFSEDELKLLLFSEPFPIKNAKEKLTYNRNFEGIARKLENAVTTRADDETAEEDKNAYTKFFKYQPCEQCGGTRLNERARNVKLNGLTIADVCRLELVDVLPYLLNINDEISKPILRKAQFLLQQLVEIGVGYLSLERSVSTLSGGESQRVKMSKQMDCNLVDMLYVLDEPSIGLHPRDTDNLMNILFRLKEKGNSVFVVEHDPDIIRAAEWIVDIGPKAGKYGGNVVYNGEPEGLQNTESITGEYLLKKDKPTFMGVFDLIRKEFASATNSEASLFSFNSKGACPKCNGQGVLTFELHFLDSVKTICDECEGKRYHSEVLELKFKGKNIAEVLDMTVNQASEFFDSSRIKRHLFLLQEVGLGYLKLGQSLSTLSGGESQRLKIATELKKEGNIYIMDEPTTGLHMSDIDNFYKIVRTLVNNENTVIIIEHNLDIIKFADWIIDMGPEGGKKGGELIFQGLPEDILNCEQSITGKY